MSTDFSTVTKGDVLPPFSFTVTEDGVRAYLDATGEAHEPWQGAVPPLAVGALALAGLMEEMPLAAGVMHTFQKLEFLGEVATDMPLTTHVTVTQRAVRAGAQFTTV